MSVCPECATSVGHYFKYCPECGHKFEKPKTRRTVGISKDKAKFKITFNSVYDEFDSMDAAQDAAYYSSWNEDAYFDGYKVEEVEYLATPDKYPYICDQCGECVTDDITGDCSFCGFRQWIKRQGE